MNKKLLIVDDDPNIRYLLKKVFRGFEDNNVDIFFAEDGMSGMALVKRERPDLVLLDINLPFMSGIEMCQEIRCDPDLKNIYIIFLTASDDDKNRKLAENLGCDGYITKPFDPECLTDKAKDILYRRPTENCVCSCIS